MYHALGAPLLARGRMDSLFSNDFIVRLPDKERRPCFPRLSFPAIHLLQGSLHGRKEFYQKFGQWVNHLAKQVKEINYELMKSILARFGVCLVVKDRLPHVQPWVILSD